MRWLERIPSSGVARTRSLLVTNPRFADLTPTQYETALDWLQRWGITADSTLKWRSPAEVVFEAAVTEAGWFPDFDMLVNAPDELPMDAIAAGEALGLADADCFRLAIGQWGKVDTEQRERVGAIGEELLVQLLRSSIVGTVEHISTLMDSAGFDVVARTATSEWHLEVKTSVRRNRTNFFLSRNEYEVMRTDPAWRLIHLTLGPSEEIAHIGTVDQVFIARTVPSDAGPHCRWHTCSMDAPPEFMQPGIPALRTALRPNAPPLLAPFFA